LLKYTIFHTSIFITFQAQSLFKQATVSLPFLPCNVSHSKQAAFILIPALLFLRFQFTLFQEVRYLLICFFDMFFFIFLKPLMYVAINKQFSFDSFLDWEGYHWDICSTCHRSQFPPLVLLLQTHLTCYDQNILFCQILGLKSNKFITRHDRPKD